MTNVEEQPKFNRTDLGNSELFIRLHGEDIRHCAESKMWFLWDGTRWKQDRLNRVRELGKDTVRTIYDELKLTEDSNERARLFKHANQSESERALRAMVNLAQTHGQIAVGAEAFDTQPHLLN